MNSLTRQQIEIIQQPAMGSLFVEGPAGCGKTRAAVERLLHLLDAGIEADTILVLAPQRTLALPYFQALRRPDLPPGGEVDVLTIGGLAQRLINLFWPVIARPAGFLHPNRPPMFLTLETAQYYFDCLVEPLITRGYFESARLDRNRLLSQVIDNLNKAAAVGFEHTDIAHRLKEAWLEKGSPTQLHLYDEAQECANLFRMFCLEHNLLDYSLQLEVFNRQLWPSFLVREYLIRTYRHLIYDNVEEDVPVAHDVIRAWLPYFDTSLLVFDQGGGYRSFLGADPLTGHSLKDVCQAVITMAESLVTPPALQQLGSALAAAVGGAPKTETPEELRPLLNLHPHRYAPEMIEWVCLEATRLVKEENVPPGEIAILSPYLSDSLRFSLMNRLEGLEIPVQSHRPSRSLAEEPATCCLLTLARLAHPAWLQRVTRTDLCQALQQAVEGFDLVRADLLARIVFNENHPERGLASFDQIVAEKKERITYTLGERYEILRRWLIASQQADPEELDVFMSRLFGEVLSQPGFGFHRSLDSAAVTARLIESIQKFRRATQGNLLQGTTTGQEYLRMVSSGVIAAQYLQSWENRDQDSVLLAPAYTFLLANRPVQYQFWIDVGSQGWWERIHQPLTHPRVLSRQWPTGAIWTDAHEVATNRENLVSLVQGLLSRCRAGVYLCLAGVNEQGSEQRSPLLMAVQNLLRRLPREQA
jgi:hypothetical protein